MQSSAHWFNGKDKQLWPIVHSALLPAISTAVSSPIGFMAFHGDHLHIYCYHFHFWASLTVSSPCLLITEFSTAFGERFASVIPTAKIDFTKHQDVSVTQNSTQLDYNAAQPALTSNPQCAFHCAFAMHLYLFLFCMIHKYKRMSNVLFKTKEKLEHHNFKILCSILWSFSVKVQFVNLYVQEIFWHNLWCLRNYLLHSVSVSKHCMEWGERRFPCVWQAFIVLQCSASSSRILTNTSYKLSATGYGKKSTRAGNQ